jgi:hypothetical protein
VSVDVDPFASLRAWGCDVLLGGRDYTLRPALAVEWLPILMTDPLDLSAIIPGMISEADADALEEALLDGTVKLAEVEQACQEVITMAAGREWWWACNLLATVAGVWMTIFGSLLRAGLDVQRLPLGALLDAMYMECASRMDKPHLQDFDRQLNIPPTGVVPVIDEDREAMNFVALMNSGV